MKGPLALAVLLLVATVAGCAAPATTPTTSAAPRPTPYISPSVPRVDAAALLADHAQFVTKNNDRAANVPTHESARADLLARFTSYGLRAVRFNFTTDIDQADILGIKWGQDREHWVFVGGHYDTTDQLCAFGISPGDTPATDCPLRHVSQGAYDDGSGTMMAVHLAKAYANVSTYYTLAFIAFDGEEKGVQGANAIVEAIQDGSFEVDGIHPTIVGDIDLDMIGINWPGTNSPITMITNSRAVAELVTAKAKAMGFPDDQLTEARSLRLGSSDYRAFMGIDAPQTVPTVFFISDFERMGAPGPAPSSVQTPFGVYPFWHLEDTVETMVAAGGGPINLETGFDSASNLASYVVHFMACEPDIVLDAKAMSTR